MTNEMMKEFAERISCKYSCYNVTKDDLPFFNNPRMNPYYSEAHGLIDALKIMGVEFEFGLDDEYKITSVTVGNYTAAVR